MWLSGGERLTKEEKADLYKWRKSYLCDPNKADGCRRRMCAYDKSHKFACYRTHIKEWAFTDKDGKPISTEVWRFGTGFTERAKKNFVKILLSRVFLFALTATNVTLLIIGMSRFV